MPLGINAVPVVMSMIRKPTSQTDENDFPIELTLHNVSASLVAEFTEKIAKPYYRGNLNAAIQDLLMKALADEDTVFSHITHVRAPVEA